MRSVLLGSIAVMLVVLVARASQPVTDSQDDQLTEQQQVEFFKKEVQPILEAHCWKCHGKGEKLRGNLHLTSRQGLLKGGDLGPAVSLDDPDSSVLLEAITYEGLEMPPSGKLPQAKIDVLTRWVKMGAPWSPDADHAPPLPEKSHAPQVNDETRKFWSYQPVRRPAVPATKNTSWVKSPIDAFVLARLEGAGLQPQPPVGKRALLRRAYYDLTGLPPSPEAVAAFLADQSPDAFERVIDQLLDSPQYGERWGRHWLDLVHFAETNSYERDGAKPYAWRYRDYVINAFNADKPFDQFILEQLAGDELTPQTPERLIATGYYRLGIWDDEPVDPEQALYDDLDDILGTTGQVFLGMSINCCRCHDHKLDPLPQRDYYRLLSFFSGVTRLGVRSADSVAKNSLRSISTGEELARQKEEVAAHQREVADVKRQMEEIEAIAKKDFVPVEHEEFKHEQNRVPLIRKRVPDVISREQLKTYTNLNKRRKELAKFKPKALSQALVVTEIGSKPRESFVLIRGNAHARGDKVEPGFPSVLGVPDPVIPPAADGAVSSGRRRALAQWIGSPDNPLTSRVMANRVWQYHFGRGIVRSPNNFGFQGTPPTHPLLLDWLASELVAGGWKLKPLHKTIMLSNSYQMSSRGNDRCLEADPENNLFWRFNMRRLAAEEIRDTILAVNGSLNPKMGGPGIYPTIPKEVLAGQSRPGSGWGRSSPEEQARRSIYIHVKRSLLTPILQSFDLAEVDASCPVRFATTQPTQALLMLNSAFLNRESAVFADYLKEQAGARIEDQVNMALKRALQRDPTEQETKLGHNLISTLAKRHGQDADQALKNFCLVVLNLNEFIYLD